MPIKPELRHLYGKQWKQETRPRILLRAGNRCEICGVPNHALVLRAAGWWTQPKRHVLVAFIKHKRRAGPLFWNPPTGGGSTLLEFQPMICRLVQIVLGVAHMNHLAGDDRDENLKAMCQWCHLNYDKEQHHVSRAIRKDLARPLLNPAAGS